MRSKNLILIVVGTLAAGAMAVVAWSAPGRPVSGSAIAPPVTNAPTFQSADHAVQLRVPAGAMEAGTEVTFQSLGDDVRNDLDASMRGVTALTQPVDVHVARGSLAPEKVSVTLAYDPGRLPQGMTDKQVGLAVFDPTLGVWVPILGASVDPQTHTVTGIAPHFSWFTAIVLNPIKAVVDFGGTVVKTVIDATVTVAQWFIGLTKDLVGDLLKDLFGIPPTLSCDQPDTAVTSTATSALNALRACTQTAGGGDTTVRLRNGYAFPLRAEKLPAGLELRISDVWADDVDLITAMRNLFWSTRHQVVLAGTSLGSVTATSKLTSATATLDLDDDAVSFDLALAVLSVLAPEATATKAAVKAGVSTVVRGGKLAATGWVKQAYGALDCIVQTAHVPAPKEAFSKESVSAQADVVHSCLGQVLDALHLKGAVADLIDVVKIAPEVVESVLYRTGAALLEQLAGYETRKPTVKVERSQLNSTFVGDWTVHGATLTINDDGSGRYTWNAGPCTSSFDDTNMCTGNAAITFTGTGATLTGRYTKVWYTGNEPYEFAVADIQVGDTFTLRRNDEHTLISASTAGDDDGPGNPYLCDDYAEAHNVGGEKYDICGA